MAIETRGNNNTLVVTNSAVPVEQITDAVTDRKDLDWICNRFPVSVDEVFECIDCIADSAKQSSYKEGITLLNTGDDINLDIETISVNDVVFFGLISYGHTLKPEALNFDEVYNVGLTNVIRDIYKDLAQGAKYFESSDLHVAVYEALLAEVGDLDPHHILASLDGES